MHLEFETTLTVLSWQNMHRHIESHPLLQIVKKHQKMGEGRLYNANSHNLYQVSHYTQTARQTEMSFQKSSQSGCLMHSEVDSHTKLR